MALQWQVVSQRNWLKGLQACFGKFAQSQGIVVRLSNLLYDVRGNFRTSDGSEVFTRYVDASDHSGPITEISLYSPAGQQPYYVGLMKTGQSGTQIPPPIPNALTFLHVGGTIATASNDGTTTTITLTAAHNLSATTNPFGTLIQSGISNPIFNQTVTFNQITIVSPTVYNYPQAIPAQSGTGGSVTTGLAASIGTGQVFTYYVTASDGQGGETEAPSSTLGSSTAPENAIKITWTAVPGAVGYNVYGRIAGSIGQINQQGNLFAGLVQGTTFTDMGGTPFPGTPPAVNTTQTVEAFLMTAPTFSNVIGVLPSFFAPPLGNIPGASNPPDTEAGAATAQGGVPGATQPLPQIIQFENQMIFALGNGYPPQSYLDTSSGGTGSLVPLGNSFNAQYTDWQASVSWNQGDIIKDSVSGGLFQASQAGTSGTTRPVFNNTLNAQTPESSPGTVVWVCIATSSTGTPLRGAANAVVYAGSLWLANTWPETTSDELDGPNCLKMSDVNNPGSWNPANIAFLDRDDGDQITAMGKFTIAEIGIAPTGSLVVCKNFSMYQVTGVFGANDFSIQNAQTDMGCIAGRTLVFIPGFGLARLCHLGFAYFNGVNDKLISEEVRPYLFGGPPDIAPIDWNFAYLSKGAQAANPPMYVAACPVLQPVLAGVTITGVTGPPFFPLFVRVEQLINEVPVAVSAEVEVNYTTTPTFTVTTPNQPGSTYRVFAGFVPGGQSRFIEQATFVNQNVAFSSMTPGYMAFGSGGLTRVFCYDLVLKQWAVIDLPFQISCLKQIRSPGTIPITVAGGASDGAVRRLFSGDVTWDDGSQVLWSFRAGEVFQQGGSAKMFYRRLVIRGMNNLNTQLNVTVNLQGNDNVMSRGIGRTVLGGPNGAKQWEMRIDILKDAENANAQISGSGPAQIQIESMDWYTKPKASGAPVTIQR